MDGAGLTRVASVSQADVVRDAARAAPNIDRSNLAPMAGIAAVPASESTALSLVAVSGNGVRLYFSTTSSGGPLERPHGITLQHVRLPPGFSASSAVPKPAKVHMCYYKQGSPTRKN